MNDRNMQKLQRESNFYPDPFEKASSDWPKDKLLMEIKRIGSAVTSQITLHMVWFIIRLQFD